MVTVRRIDSNIHPFVLFFQGTWDRFFYSTLFNYFSVVGFIFPSFDGDEIVFYDSYIPDVLRKSVWQQLRFCGLENMFMLKKKKEDTLPVK